MSKIPKELQALTKKQRDFVIEYAKTGNGTQSMNKAGYKGKEDSLAAQASRMLKNVKVKAALDSVVKPSLEKSLITIERFDNELAKYAFAEPTKTFPHTDKKVYVKMAGDRIGAWKVKEPENPFGKGVKSISVKFE